MVIGIVVAMIEEASPIIEKLKLEGNGEGVFRGKVGEDTVILMLSGIGKVNAQNTTWKLISLGAERIMNIGTCGDLAEREIGTIVLPNIFFDGDFDLSMMDNTTKDPANVNWRYIATASSRMPAIKEPCYTYSTFITDKRANGAIVDMEAYAVAAACVTVGVKFIAVKCISDGADDNASDNFDNNVSVVIKNNVDDIISFIEKFDDVYEKVYKLED